MFSKKFVSILAAFFTGAIILVSSCKKNDDVSSNSFSPENEMSVSGTSSGISATAGQTSTAPSAYTITSHDGHIIGINGTLPGTSSVPPKNQVNNASSCEAVYDLAVVPYSDGLGYGELHCTWNSSGFGAGIALFINGKIYNDPSTGFGFWSMIVTGIHAQCQGISGGIQPNEKFDVFVRTYCNIDTTLGERYDTPITTIIIPSNFSPACGSSGGTTPPKKKGGGKH